MIRLLKKHKQKMISKSNGLKEEMETLTEYFAFQEMTMLKLEKETKLKLSMLKGLIKIQLGKLGDILLELLQVKILIKVRNILVI